MLFDLDTSAIIVGRIRPENQLNKSENNEKIYFKTLWYQETLLKT